MSLGVYLVMFYVYYLLGEEIIIGKVELIESILKIVFFVVIIFRFWDDFGSVKVILN